MRNYWFIPRPKRHLNSVPKVLAVIATTALEVQWKGNRDVHLAVEEALENAEIKRKGDRRDQGGSGGRTYISWIKSLGLLFEYKKNILKLTLAGESVLKDKFPCEVIKNQVLKFQFPSNYSVSPHVDVNKRFKIHPFIFLLRILDNKTIEYLTQDEIAYIIILHAENETDSCFEKVCNRIIDYRNNRNDYLDNEDFSLYQTTKGKGRAENPQKHLDDIANTIINWLEYTQLAKRDEDKKLRILDEKREEVHFHLSKQLPFIDRPEDEDFFQRKYGLDTKHSKDTRNLAGTQTITDTMIVEQKIKTAFISLSLRKPISGISKELVEEIAKRIGVEKNKIEDYLMKAYPHGAIDSFMYEYFEMAFKGREDATEFEKATAVLFHDIFHYNAKHIGPMGLTPDVLLISDSDGYQAVIDNKAYSKYDLPSDHRNRMIHNYIRRINNFSDSEFPLAFFTYIAGGFCSNINSKIKIISDESSVNGSAITVLRFIELIKQHRDTPFTHSELRTIFSLNREIRNGDFTKYSSKQPVLPAVASNISSSYCKK